MSRILFRKLIPLSQSWDVMQELAMERRTGRTDSNCRYADMIRCMMSEVLPMIWHQGV